MKKFICFIFAVMVAVVPSFAWNAESFLEVDYDSQDIYSFDPVYEVNDRGPMMFAARSRSSSGSSSIPLSDLFINYPVSYDKTHSYVQAIYESDYYYPNIVSFPSGGIPLGTPFSSTGGIFFSAYQVSIPASYNGYSFMSCAYPTFFDIDVPIPEGDDPDNYLRITVDVSSFASSSIAFEGSVYFRTDAFGGSSYHDFDLYVDDSLVGSFKRELGGLVWSQSTDIQTISFVLKNSIINSHSSGVFNLYIRYADGSSGTISFLREDSALTGFNNQAQSDINQHNQIESQWTGSMTDNFDALNIDNFTFPVGLVSAFGLISGIFNDLWNGMGEYRIVYVFPLMLGIVLLLVGRLSKFSGGQSSSVKNRGDSSA